MTIGGDYATVGSVETGKGVHFMFGISRRKPVVLVVPFSGGTSGDFAFRAAYVSLELYKGGLQVILQDCNKLKKRNSLPKAILQIGIGAMPHAGLVCLGELGLMYPDIPRVVISEWKAEDIAKEVNWHPIAKFLHWPSNGEGALVQTMRDLVRTLKEVIRNKTAPSK